MSNPEKKEKKNKYYYAVKCGFKPGIYTKWEECKEQVNGFPKPVYKKFDTEEDAKIFINPECSYLVSETTKSELIDGIEFSEYVLDKYISTPETWNKYNNKLYIFTDGSDVGNGNTRIGIYFGKRAVNISQDIPNSTNNRCELTAILYSLKYMNSILKQIKEYQKKNSLNKICIISDSNYSVSSCNKWIDTWVKNNWIKKDGNIIENKDLMFDIYMNLSKLRLHKIKYEILFVNSHRTPPLNDEKKYFLWRGNYIADYLARLY